MAQFSLVVAAWSGGFLVVGPVVAERSLGGAAAWGQVAGAHGLGLLAGAIIALRVVVRRPMRVATFAVFTFALPLLLLAPPTPLAVIAAGAFVAGMGGELFGVLWFTALHTHVAPQALSRVSAYDILGSIALTPLGVAAAGQLVESLGTGPTLWLASGLVVAPTLAVLAVPEVWNLSSQRPERIGSADPPAGPTTPGG